MVIFIISSSDFMTLLYQLALEQKLSKPRIRIQAKQETYKLLNVLELNTTNIRIA